MHVEVGTGAAYRGDRERLSLREERSVAIDDRVVCGWARGAENGQSHVVHTYRRHQRLSHRVDYALQFHVIERIDVHSTANGENGIIPEGDLELADVVQRGLAVVLAVVSESQEDHSVAIARNFQRCTSKSRCEIAFEGDCRPYA